MFSNNFKATLIYSIVFLLCANVVFARWMTVDPKHKKYPSVSPYVYALNNPLKFVDPDGKDVAFNTYQTPRTKQYGHTNLYFQDSKGSWFKYDQGDYGAKLSNADGPPKGSLLLRTTPKQDKAIAESAIKSVADHDSGQKKYDELTNNCTDAAIDVVNDADAGVTVDERGVLETPAEWSENQKNATTEVNSQNEDADATNVVIEVPVYEVVE